MRRAVGWSLDEWRWVRGWRARSNESLQRGGGAGDDENRVNREAALTLAEPARQPRAEQGAGTEAADLIASRSNSMCPGCARSR